MGKSRRGRRSQAGARRRKALATSLANPAFYRALAFDPLENRTLLTASLNVYFQVDAPAPVSSLSVGENFTLKVFVQDNRSSPTGLNQAYFDLAYDTSIAQVTGPVVNGADFDVTATGNDSTAGQIKDAGGLSTTSIPPSPANAQQLLFSVPMKAIGGGQFNLTPSLSTNPSDVVLFFFSASGVPLNQMAFSGTPLTVTSGPAASSINTADTSPTNSSLVHYTVNFNEAVSGVDASDFGLAQSGITGSTIASVSPNSGFNSSYTVTVNAGSLTSSTGTLGLNLIDGDTITDSASNTLAGGHSGSTLFTGGTYTIDRTAPTVSSIVTVNSTPTHASSVQYTVTFSKSVTGVANSDFHLATSGITGASIAGVTGSGTTYTVTVNTGSGDGTLGLNLIDGPAAITDSAGNTLAGGNTGATIYTGQTYTVRKTPPAVSSIVPANGNPTNAASVPYTVTFNEAATGVNATDFALAASGILGATISNVSGSGTTYTVTVATGTGNGSLGLNFIDGSAAVSDAAGNTVAGGNTSTVLFTGTPAYTIDKTPISVSSITLLETSPTNRASVDFTVTFNKSVSGVSPADFALATSGISGASITGVSGSGSTYTVTANSGSGNGSLGLNLINGSATISDSAGNALAGANTGAVLSTGPTYTIDKSPVSVSSIALVGSSPTNAASVAFTVIFNKSVTGLAQSDFALATSGISGASVTNLTGSGTTYTVTASTGTGNGTLSLNLINGPATISDSAGNTLAGGNTSVVISTGPTYTIDKTPINVNSIALVQSSPTNAASVSFTITFNKSVSGLTQADFALGATGISGASITNVTGSGSTYTVSASTGTGNGSLGLNLIDGPAKISDAVGNTLAGGNSDSLLFAGTPTYTIDKTPVSVSSIALAGTATTNAATVGFTVTFNQSVTGVSASDFKPVTGGGISGAAVTNVAGSGTTWTVTVKTGTGDGTLGLNFIDGSATISDAAGNTAAGGGTLAVLFAGTSSYTIDKTPPAVSQIAASDLNPTAASTVHFAVTFAESVTGVVAGDFALAASGVTGASISSVTGSGANWTVTVSTGTGNGTLGLNLIDGPTAITDAAGNTLGGGSSGSTIFTGASYTLDRTLPSVVSVLPADGNPTNRATVDFTVTFSESVTGVDTTDFAAVASGVTGAQITAVNGSGGTWTVTVSTGSGNGTLGLNVVDGHAITDSASKVLAGGNTGKLIIAGTTPYTIDKTPVSVSSIALIESSSTNLASVDFTVTFNKGVTGVNASDFAVVAGGSVTGASITSVTGSGTTWKVTASTGMGSGTLGLDFIDGAATVTDAAGNTAAGGHSGAVLFAGTNSYTIDKTPISVSSIALADSSPSNLAAVGFTVTFNKSVTGVAASDFAIAASGLTGAAIAGISGSGTTWTVTVNTGTGNGTLGLHFIDGPAIVTDAAGNALAGSNSGSLLFAAPSSYSIDKTPVNVGSIALVGSNSTNAASVGFTVTFSKSVSGVSASDFALVRTGITGASITSVSGSGASYTVTVSTGTGSGTLGLSVIDGPAKISDAAGNSLAGANTGNILFTGTSLFTIDKTPLNVNAMSLVEPSLTNRASVDFTVSFNKSVTGLSPADFALSTTGLTGAAITGVTGSGTTYTVTASTGTGNGTLGLKLIDGSAKISDAAGNTLAGSNTSAVLFSSPSTYNIDKTAVVVSSIAAVSPGLTNANSVAFTVTFNKSVTGVSASDFSLVTNGLTGAAISSVTGSGTTWTVAVNTGTGTGTLGLNVIDGPAKISDAAGNTLAGGNTNHILLAGTQVYTIDKTAPSVSSISLVGKSPTNAASVTFNVTFSESVTGVAAADFALATSGITGAAITNVTGSGTAWTVTASTGSGSGTLGLNLIDGPAKISDAIGNTLAGGNTSHILVAGTQVYSIDKTPPAVLSIAPSGSNPTSGPTAQFAIKFSKAVIGVDSSDFSLKAGGGVVGANITGIAGGGAAWTVTVNTGSGNGSVTLNLIDGDSITDAAGNVLAGRHTGATLFTGDTPTTIEKTPPSVSSITLADTNPVSAPATVHFTVTFSEAVAALDTSDFAITQSGLTGSAITGVSGGGTTWTVAATTGKGNGTLGLKLIDGDAIVDAGGNKLAGGHTGNAIFSSTASYNVSTAGVTSISVVGLQVNATKGTTVTNAEVATFTSTGGAQTAGDFTAAIDWGDGNTSTGTVAAIASGFSVTGSHNYASPGDRPLKITVQSGGIKQQGETTATVGSSTELFVAQVYRDLLHREIEPQGLQFWTNVIDGGLSRQAAAADIEYSPEFRNAVVQGLYQLYLHRAAEPAAVSYYSNLLLNGGTPEQIASVLASSDEYFNGRSGATATGFMNAFYHDALNRNADAQALQNAGKLDLTKQSNRLAIVEAVFAGGEYQTDLVNYPSGVSGNSFHSGVPFGFFQDYLGRDAEQAAITAYANQLSHGQPDIVIINQILASDEYFARAATQPS